MKIAYSGAHFTKQSHADTAGCNVYIQSGYLMMLTVKSPNRHTVKCYRRPWVVIQININIQLDFNRNNRRVEKTSENNRKQH
nr:MAG TPA: hypothetical protein [Caudoviricetes sp.]